MRKALCSLFLFCLTLILVACSPISTSLGTDTSSTVPSSTPSSSVSIAQLISAKNRNIAPTLASSDIDTLVSGNDAFAWALYQQLALQDGNLLLSPYSLSLVLAMTYNGAKGETAQQISETLHFSLPTNSLNSAFDYLELALSSRATIPGAQATNSQGFVLNVADDLWGQNSYPFLPIYLDNLAEYYGAGLRVLDFKHDAEAARQSINQYISDQTNGRIQNLIPEGAVNNLTRLVLTNAIYFKAAWLHQFSTALTQDNSFYLLNGDQVSVPTMSQQGDFKYAADNSYQAVELPYVGGQLAMDIIMPNSGQFPSFEKSLNQANVKSIIDSLSTAKLQLSMPKFQYDSQFDLKSILMAMGMTVPFSDVPGVADFSGMVDESKVPPGEGYLAISEVLHKAFISVDEGGTEAAAASAVIMTIAPTANTSTPLIVKLDHPFVFIIRDVPTGTILFMGRVTNPATP